MAKGQKKSNKEIRKPKAEKPKAVAAAPSFPGRRFPRDEVAALEFGARSIGPPTAPRFSRLRLCAGFIADSPAVPRPLLDVHS